VLQLFGSQPHNWSKLVFRRRSFNRTFEMRFGDCVEVEFQASAGGLSCQISQQLDWRTFDRSWSL
jgi:hypothetical protein